MKKYIIKIIGKKKGKITVIMAWVHWDEKSGIIAIKKIAPIINISWWVVYFIIANIKAIKKNTRYIEQNLNRCFKKKIIGLWYEQQRAKEIRKVIKSADYLLDIHNTIKPSKPFLISERKDINKYFPVKRVISGLDNLHPGGSDGYMNAIWKKGICIECGGIDNEWWNKVAENAIINFLKFTWNIEGKPKKYKNQNSFNFYKIYKTKTDTFILAKTFKAFEKTKKGTIIGYDGDRTIKSEKNSYILFPKNCNKKWSEAFIVWK
jgi:succinylglutamate desuccinylase